MTYQITIDDKYIPVLQKLAGDTNIVEFIENKITTDIKSFIDYNFIPPVLTEDEKIQVVLEKLN